MGKRPSRGDRRQEGVYYDVGVLESVEVDMDNLFVAVTKTAPTFESSRIENRDKKQENTVFRDGWCEFCKGNGDNDRLGTIIEQRNDVIGIRRGPFVINEEVSKYPM